MSYTQLSAEERYQISALKKAGWSIKQIASELGRHQATIYREISRNTGKHAYWPKQAQRLARARKAHQVWHRYDANDWQQVEQLLNQDFSPEQIRGRLEAEGLAGISHEWIYQYVYANKRQGGDLYCHLRRRKRYRKRVGGYERRGKMNDAVSIEQRPKHIEKRNRLGHWEGDTVVGGQRRGALLTMVERKSRFSVICPMAKRKAEAVRLNLKHALTPIQHLVHSITFDNGKEFAEHQAIAKDLETAVYFAHPYASHERGTNENTNGLIRQYFPKKQPLDTVTTKQTQTVMNKLNHRPRKCLGYKTPFEVFFGVNYKLVALGT